jgi:hypothetical protein
MDTFDSFGVEIDDVLDWHDGPSLIVGHDLSGRRYLAVQVVCTPAQRCWLVAAISVVALRCVLAGRAELRDVFRHTPTGFVETFRVDRSGRASQSVRLCADLSEDDLPGAGQRLALVA